MDAAGMGWGGWRCANGPVSGSDEAAEERYKLKVCLVAGPDAESLGLGIVGKALLAMVASLIRGLLTQRVLWLAACLAVGLVASANANAQQKTQAGSPAKAASLPPISDLIGREIVDVHYPDGWVYRGGGGSVNVPGPAIVQRGKEHGILMERLTEKPLPGQRTKHIVLSALAVKVDPGDWYKFSQSCKWEGTNDYVFAEVRFKRCERYSTRVSRAWVVDPKTWAFVPISPKGMRFENIGWNEIADEPACPSGIDISAKVTR